MTIDPQILQWLAGISRDMESTLRNEAPNLYLQHTHAVDSAALDSAVCAHLEWRERLEELLAGGAGEKIEAGIAGRDDVCALGRWIHGDGGARFGEVDAFRRLRKHHAAFHALVAAAVEAANAGDAAGARAVAAGKAYQDTSWEIVRAIADIASVLGGRS